ncbi:MAG: glycosyltransferase family 39 protein [Prevotellaceae bacterium]|jgi:4-amino-4-deoxy-L-arabinose transferase-like glycosyltransferase|nr:glycosyltransferase family 39 protein [Prevotellaceae bacterium]
MLKKSQTYSPYFIIFLVAALLFVPFLGKVHLFDWDEINFAESAREMIVTNDYSTVRIDFAPFWEKPPLFIWMQAISMKLFGINEFAARFPNALCGIFTLLFLFRAGRKLYNDRFGALWVLSYAGSILPFFYFKSGIIDPWLNLFIFIGIYYITLFFDKDARPSTRPRHLVLSAAAIGLGILTKGPVALLIWGLTVSVYILIKKFRVSVRWHHPFLFLFVLLLVGGSWFWGQIIAGNKQTVIDFITYQIRLFRTEDAGHGGFFLYHFVVLFFGVFPASVFSFAAYSKNEDDSYLQKNFKTWMTVLLLVVLILFTIVKTKIVHYSSMCYFPLTFLGAYALYNYCYRGARLKKWIRILAISLAALYAIITIILTNISRFKDYILENELLDDPFALANLQADAGWTGYESLIALIPLSLIFMLIYFHRKGKTLSYVLSASVSVCLFTFLTLVFVVKRVEAYSQRAALEFFESKSNDDCYMLTINYFSYAPYFYGKTHRSMSEGINRLKNNDISIPIYVSVKNTSRDEVLNQYPQLEVLYEKNGFVFMQSKGGGQMYNPE